MTRATKRAVPQTGTIGGIISDFYAAAQELRDEMQEAYDNTPESLQSSSVGEARQECADNIGNFCDDEQDTDGIGDYTDVTVTYTEDQRKGLSRRDRMGNAVSMLDAAIDKLRSEADDLEAAEDREGQSAEERDELLSAMRELADQLEEHKDEADGIEFPGRNG